MQHVHQTLYDVWRFWVPWAERRLEDSYMRRLAVTWRVRFHVTNALDWLHTCAQRAQHAVVSSGCQGMVTRGGHLGQW